MNINNQEIERKFLVATDDYRRLATNTVEIRQGYLSVNEKSTVRIRRWNDQAFITIKSRGRDGSCAHFEWEKEVSLADFDALFPLCSTGIIHKTRFMVPMGDLVCEVDEFHGLNEGLILAEIELPYEDFEISFPDFLLFKQGDAPHVVEVTDDKRYYNSYLSQCPYSVWAEKS